MKPNDKPFVSPNDSIEEPKLYTVVGRKKFPRPSLETSFVDYEKIDD